jgi:hypothetical protein
MRDLDERSGSEEDNFQSRPKKAQKGGNVNGDGKTSKAIAEEEGPALVP